MTDTEHWLTMALCPGLGTMGATRLLQNFGSPADVLAASAQQLTNAGATADMARDLLEPDAARLQQALEWLGQPDHHLLTPDSSTYPHLLIESGAGPLCLFVAGDPECLALPQLAIVGSRNATPAGIETAREFAALLARSGLIITSGLAQGIDTAAHVGALRGKGKTIAVLGNGLDQVYPRENAALAEKIISAGALVSEFPPGTPPRRDQFPRRNRIISALSLGTLVVEAGIRSGSLITARLAGEMGREIFAIPGSIHSPVSKGCHRLIRQGAKLVESAADIMEELAALTGALEQAPADVAMHSNDPTPIDPDYAKVLGAMGFDPVSINQLAERSGLTAEELSSMLLILELEGRVNSLPGGLFQQTKGVESTE